MYAYLADGSVFYIEHSSANTYISKSILAFIDKSPRVEVLFFSIQAGMPGDRLPGRGTFNAKPLLTGRDTQGRPFCGTRNGRISKEWIDQELVRQRGYLRLRHAGHADEDKEEICSF